MAAMAGPPGGLFHEAYVPPARMAALRQYKYSGVDLSFVSNYIMQPYWSRLVFLFPMWMACVADLADRAPIGEPTVARRP